MFNTILSVKCNEKRSTLQFAILGLRERVKKGFFKLVRRLPYLKDRVRDIYICTPIHKITLHYILFIHVSTTCMLYQTVPQWLLTDTRALNVFTSTLWIFAVQPILLKAASSALMLSQIFLDPVVMMYSSALCLLMSTDS